VSLLLQEDFIKGFVKQGWCSIFQDVFSAPKLKLSSKLRSFCSGDVSLMSIGTQLDVDDCIALTPSGHLILSLRREIYQELGLEGTPTFTKDKNPQRYSKYKVINL